jgi:hypothetical protein
MMEPRLFRIATLIYYGTYMVKALIWIPLFGGGFAAHDVPTLLYWTALSATAIYLVTVIVTALSGDLMEHLIRVIEESGRSFARAQARP